ncbi:MAG: G1 family glutamic endopeptidase [Nitrososphaerota archaeon]
MAVPSLNHPKAFAVGALFAIVALLVAAAPAAAGHRGPRRLGPVEGRLHIGRKEESSTNWSGYAAYGQTFTEARGSWVQPAANCTLKGRQFALAAFWIGLDGYGNKTVEQTGTEADCEGTEPIYYAWYELYPERLFLIEEPVEPGDVLNAVVTQGTLELEDETAGWTATEKFPTAGLEFSSAEWIAEAPFRRFTDFGSVHFSGASASTSEATGAISAWEYDSVTLVSGHGRHSSVLAEPGALEAGGSAFTITQP